MARQTLLIDLIERTTVILPAPANEAAIEIGQELDAGQLPDAEAPDAANPGEDFVQTIADILPSVAQQAGDITDIATDAIDPVQLFLSGLYAPFNDFIFRAW